MRGAESVPSQSSMRSVQVLSESVEKQPPPISLGLSPSNVTRMFVITDNDYARAWSAIGRILSRLQAVPCISAHLCTPARAGRPNTALENSLKEMSKSVDIDRLCHRSGG